ncbi:DUF4974 domain-containing protein [Pedobacter sp. MC2016-15]|uniref:FecR family protein n=1 Tax=Pedobacter sp. MC2016-15 TaxID=2994473 RepID=UPI002246B862|nr:FecR family protein [Pedobacter sp. MC2016-15]MCX2480643.1 DUF4974 domain-containing protein [Pedobacter sp. MC2016-15]
MSIKALRRPMNDRIKYLYSRYRDNRCTPEEWEELMTYLEDEDLFATMIDQSWNNQENSADSLSADSIERLQQAVLKHPKTKNRKSGNWYAYAAAAVIAVFFSIQFFQTRTKDSKVNTAQTYTRIADVPPGKDNAVLILDNGIKIDLEKLVNNEIVNAGNLTIRKKQQGWIVIGNNINSAIPSYTQLSGNIIRTPRGGEYKVTLPDGSLVTLNASSSLSFPDIFSKSERRVALSGEGFFDIKHKDLNQKQKLPFIVHTENHDVKVLGTAFNIQAYPQQKHAFTTLVRGVVKIGKASGPLQQHEQILKPGEQAAVSAAGAVNVKTVDLEEVTAWKEGYFLFNNQPLPAIMDQVARWYDVDLEYAGKAKSVEFFGIYSRSKSLKFLLQNLEKTGKVQFDILSDKNHKERRIKIRISYT